MKTTARLLSLVLCLLLQVACSFEKSDLEYAPEKAPAPTAESESKPLTFREVQDGVFLPKCQQCHERVGSELQFVNYDNVKGFLSGIRFRVFERGDMPRGQKLTSDEMALLKNWIDQGGPL